MVPMVVVVVIDAVLIGVEIMQWLVVTVISHSSDWLSWQRLVMAVVGHDGECLWPLVVIW